MEEPPNRPTDPEIDDAELAIAGLADEVGDDLLDQFRAIDAPEPRGQLAAVLRARLLRRTRYRGSLEPWDLGERLHALGTRFGFLVRHSLAVRVLSCLMLIALLAWTTVPPILGLLDVPPRAGSFKASVVPSDRLTGPAAAPAREHGGRELRLTWLASENDLRHLRALCDERGKVALRRRLLKIGGADERTREWIEVLSADVADDLRSTTVGTDYASVESFSLGLRALLGAGSTTMRGPYAGAVRDAMNRLERLLPELQGPALATALAGYLEGALVTGGARLDRLSRALRRFTSEQFELLAPVSVPVGMVRVEVPSTFVPAIVRRQPAPMAVRPAGDSVREGMTAWTCPLGALADAGIILRIAPALGVPADQAARVRNALYAHLGERGYAAPGGKRQLRPGAGAAASRAAMLFSYEDLADRDELAASLRGYCLNPDRFGRDIRAVHYLAWGMFPGAGWARFNQALRYFTANYTDRTPTERAGLLLVQLLYTAPGLAQAGGTRTD